MSCTLVFLLYFGDSLRNRGRGSQFELGNWAPAGFFMIA